MSMNIKLTFAALALTALASHALADDQDLVLNDDFVSPDAGSPLVADEAGSDEDTELPAEAVDPFADIDSPTAVEVKVVPTQTTSIAVTGQQFAYVDAIRKRNEHVYGRRVSPDVSEASEAKESKAAVASAPAVAAPVPSPPSAPLMEEKVILEDKHGQWATTASASSTYGTPTQPKAPYAPWQATGAPNVTRYSDSPAAWTTKSGDQKDPEWLEVGFAKPVHATSLRIRQTAAPGAIARVELIDAAHESHTLWEGTDATPYAKNSIGWFVKDTPRTSYVVTGVRITLMTARVWGYNEIDAVQLVGEE